MLPSANAAAATVDAAEPRAALVRLAAASARKDGKPAVGLTWSNGGDLSLCLAREDGIAADSVDATATGSARIACATTMLATLIEATGAERVRLSVEDRPGAALRIDAANEVTAVIAPIYWPGARADWIEHRDRGKHGGPIR
jgi:hypothetical protein